MNASQNVVKAAVFGGTPVAKKTIASVAVGVDGTSEVTCPYDLDLFGRLFDVSGALQTCVDSYATNIEGDYALQPRVDMESQQSVELVRQAMYQAELVLDDRDDDLDDDDEVEPELPTAEEAQARLATLRGRMIREQMRAEQFFEGCCTTGTFRELRARRRRDLETYGNAYWEVVREAVEPEAQELDENGRLVRLPRPRFLGRISPRNVRLTEVGEDVLVYKPLRTTLLSVELVPTPVQFRRYKVTTKAGHVRWYKQYGDPRIMSPRTGEYYDSIEKLRAKEPEVTRPATEIVHFYLGEGPYGRPRWFGELQTVLGVRKAQEANVFLLDRGGVPAFAVVVTGGALTEDAEEKIRAYAEEQLRGPEGINAIMVLQADALGDGSTKIEIVPLGNQQQRDGLYMQFIELGYDLIGRAFRLPKLLRGDAADQNRATAIATLDFAESQVFGPERALFDDWMTQFLFEGLDIRYWYFTTIPARIANPELLAKVINDGVKAGWLMIADARTKGPELGLDMDLAAIDRPWAKQPLALTLAGMAGPESEPELDDALDSDTTPAADEVGQRAADALANLRAPAEGEGT